jgi:uncharacterized protein (DUF2164 family)
MPDAPLIAIPDDARKRAITSIRRFFADTLDEEIGDLKATLVLDYVLTELAPTVYNQAIADARAFFEERVADLDGVCHRKEFPLTRR